MPEICRFRGIVVLMFGNEGGHQVGHFHVFYAEHRASMAFDGSVIVGGLPRAQLKLVRDWAAMHQAELTANWARCRDGNPPRPIDPPA